MANIDINKAIFRNCKPTHLKIIDWTILNHRRIVAASLVEGVYEQEKDRQKKKEVSEHKPQAPIWWESYHFRHVEDIKDDYLHSHSIFGSIFKYKPPNKTIFKYKPPNKTFEHHENRPPKYVIAFRGTLLKSRTILKDVSLDAKLLLNLKTRYKSSLQPVNDLIDKVGVENVWLTGHSLGAAIALQVGKTMAKNGCYIQTYLFNPPYCTSPIEMLHVSPNLKTGLRMARNVVTAGVSAALKTVITRDEEEDLFTKLCPWRPYLFVNKNDPISCEYIGFFEHREKMESWGVGLIQKYIAKISFISVASSVYGIDDEALHQIPSAFLVKNCEAKDPHANTQWFEPHLDLQANCYMAT